ncbi:MAG: efflux RND transporter periplasmic adaptor subunit [Planctomycetia bacterium]
MTRLGQIVGWIAPVIILGIGIGIFMGMGKQPPPERVDAGAQAAVAVRTAAVRPERGGVDVEADGVVVPVREVTLAAEVGGKVLSKSKACNEGERVTKGTLLFEIDPRDYELEVDRLERECSQAGLAIEEIDEEIAQNADTISLAKRQVELAQRETTRLEGLKSGRIVTESEHDRAIRDELTAVNSLTTLEGQRRVLTKRRTRLVEARSLAGTMLERAKLDLSRTKVFAPADGVVVEDKVEQDSFVAKGAPLVTIEDTSAAEVKASLPMDDVARIWSGGESGATGGRELPPTPATVVYSLGDRSYQWQGILSRQEGRGLDEKTRTLPCRVTVPAPDAVTAIDRYGAAMPQLPAGSPRALLRGMFVHIRVHVEDGAELVSIPEEALRPTGEVWVMRDGRLVILQPRPLAIRDRRVVFDGTESGLLPGDRVVTSQLARPRDGLEVVEAGGPMGEPAVMADTPGENDAS